MFTLSHRRVLVGFLSSFVEDNAGVLRRIFHDLLKKLLVKSRLPHSVKCLGTGLNPKVVIRPVSPVRFLRVSSRRDGAEGNVPTSPIPSTWVPDRAPVDPRSTYWQGINKRAHSPLSRKPTVMYRRPGIRGGLFTDFMSHRWTKSLGWSRLYVCGNAFNISRISLLLVHLTLRYRGKVDGRRVWKIFTVEYTLVCHSQWNPLQGDQKPGDRPLVQGGHPRTH